MTMTAEEVVRLADVKARASGLKWHLFGDSDAIRCGERCPLEVAGETMSFNYFEAATKLNVHGPAREIVLGAADNTWMTLDKSKLRALMLATFDFAGEAHEANQ